ncbi:MAG: hypothetical protein KGZ25_14665 [Planctomycetes bacterium]|nr:hypothetical protein [Planctomycetota bacterium]
MGRTIRIVLPTLCVLLALIVLPAAAGEKEEEGKEDGPTVPTLTQESEEEEEGEEKEGEEGEEDEEEKKKKKGFKARTREKYDLVLSYWQEALEGLSSEPVIGWPVVLGSVLIGLVLLGFGWTLLKLMFVPFATLMGFGAGAFMGMQLSVSAFGSIGAGAKVGIVVGGALFFLILFLLTAIKARPVAWLLIVTAPFLVLSTLIFPLTALAGILCAAIGILLGLLSSLHRRSLAILSTALLGSILLVFAWALATFLIKNPSLNSILIAVMRDKPLYLLAIIGLVAFIGGDVQVVLGPPDDKSGK